MSMPLLLLVIVAPIGAIDMLYFHLWKYRLYASSRSRSETVTHILRSMTVATLAWVLAHYRPTGTWFWVVGSLFLIDFVNSLIDVAIEPRSRAALGGVPGAESVIHTVGSTALGAIAALYFSLGWQDRLLPTALTSTTGTLSPILVLQGELVAVSGAMLTLLELGLLLCSLGGWCLPPRTSKSAGLRL